MHLPVFSLFLSEAPRFSHLQTKWQRQWQPFQPASGHNPHIFPSIPKTQGLCLTQAPLCICFQMHHPFRPLPRKLPVPRADGKIPPSRHSHPGNGHWCSQWSGAPFLYCNTVSADLKCPASNFQNPVLCSAFSLPWLSPYQIQKSFSISLRTASIKK